MKLTLSINMDNAAFEDIPGVEAARILRDAANKVSDAQPDELLEFRLSDANGNKVGSVIVSD